MTNVFQRSMAVVLAVSLTGCAIVSPQLKPEVPVAGMWNEASPASAAVATLLFGVTFALSVLAIVGMGQGVDAFMIVRQPAQQRRFVHARQQQVRLRAPTVAELEGEKYAGPGPRRTT